MHIKCFLRFKLRLVIFDYLKSLIILFLFSLAEICSFQQLPTGIPSNVCHFASLYPYTRNPPTETIPTLPPSNQMNPPPPQPTAPPPPPRTPHTPTFTIHQPDQRVEGDSSGWGVVGSDLGPGDSDRAEWFSVGGPSRPGGGGGGVLSVGGAKRLTIEWGL